MVVGGQGTLASLTWPHVFIADSLAMGEAAVKMASSGEVDSIVCMGVDFMAESVRATLDSNDFQVRKRRGGGGCEDTAAAGGAHRAGLRTSRVFCYHSVCAPIWRASLNAKLSWCLLNGWMEQKIPVFRLSDRKIGCSLAESAERAAYAAWLKQASTVPNSLHVVYINTSLVTKAQAHEVVPTITCTSSNVLQTILQAYHQIPDLTIW